MRLFVCIDMPAAINEHLGRLQKQIKGARCSFTPEFHLTLRFLGDVDEQELLGIKMNLGLIRFGAFEARLRNIGTFPGGARVSVVWAGLEPADLIHALQRSVARALVGVGEPEDFQFKPHVTIARIKNVEDKGALFNSLRGMHVDPMTLKVDRFRLVESTLTEKGPVHKTLAVFRAKE